MRWWHKPFWPNPKGGRAEVKITDAGYARINHLVTATLKDVSAVRETKAKITKVLTRLRNCVQAGCIAKVIYKEGSASERAAAKRNAFIMLDKMNLSLPRDLSALLAAA